MQAVAWSEANKSVSLLLPDSGFVESHWERDLTHFTQVMKF